MSPGVLDTSVLIATDVSPLPGELQISVMSLAEIRFGVLVARDADRRARRLRLLSRIERRFDALPVDEAVAEAYAELAAKVVSVGRNPRGRVIDLVIAATARAHGATLYTRNPKDFSGLHGLVTVEVA